jgi:TatD DNase family protein
MGLIDTHTHLDSFAREGALAGVLERARAAGLEGMIAIGTAPDDWAVHREIARSHPRWVHYTVGLHPCSVGADWREVVAQIGAFWANSALAPVALGECGLDRFHLPKDPGRAEEVFGWQRAAFAEQLGLARGLGCPLVVHSRGAFSSCVALIDESGIDWNRVVFHCFSEGPDEMAELIRRGGRGSFTGILTYKNAANVRDAAKAQGLGLLMVETDAPFLAPAPHRGERNEPALVRYVADQAAELFAVSSDQVADITSANARAFFNL